MSYIVSFDVQGHGVAPPNQVVDGLKPGQSLYPESSLYPCCYGKATRPPDPTEAGYAFCGWFCEASCTTAFDFSSNITDNITLFASWENTELAANRYNHATPLSSVHDFTAAGRSVVDAKYFVLSDNILDGTYLVITGDVGLWDNILPDAQGELSSPYVITVYDTVTIRRFRMLGSTYSYPVAFTVTFYSNDTALYTITETANTDYAYEYILPSNISVDKYVISVTKISSTDAVRVFSAGSNDIVHINSTDTFKPLISVEASSISLCKYSADTLKCKLSESSTVCPVMYSTDTLKVEATEDVSMTNVHTRMKEPSRQIYGKVYITYTDPIAGTGFTVQTSSDAYNSNKDIVPTNGLLPAERYFALYDDYYPPILSDQYSIIGWVSGNICKADRTFDSNPWLKFSFTVRPVVDLYILFDNTHESIPEDFTVVFTKDDNSTVTKTFTGNTESRVLLSDITITDVVEITVTVTKMSKAYTPANIVGIPMVTTILYKGYQDASDLISIDLLEELTYEDDIEALGGMSANEVTVVLDNSSRDFFFNSRSLVASQLTRNKKIEPWLGVEVLDGEIEWYKLGTYWSFKWDVPVNGLTASVVGFDTIGLLDLTTFTEHTTQINQSIGDLIEYVLDDAAQLLSFIEYDIDDDLYDITIPYAWFDAGSHAAALSRISACYPMHIYCDRDGKICARPQRLAAGDVHDTWSNSTNVIETNFSSLYTVLPNKVNVSVVNATVKNDAQLASDENIKTAPTDVTLNFSNPYISDIDVEVDCDSGVSYTYTAYSWGIKINFTGSGDIRSITCTGTALDTTNTHTLSQEDSESIRINGTVSRDVSSDFIQTDEMANAILSRIFSLSENDKYDATVKYRGDIALSINDSILVSDSIAPVDKYTIKRHELSWNGSLTGSAELNT